MGCMSSIPFFELLGTYYGKCIYVLDHHTCIVKIRLNNNDIKLILMINNLNELNENFDDYMNAKLILEKIILNKNVKIEILDYCSDQAKGNLFVLENDTENDLIDLLKKM